MHYFYGTVLGSTGIDIALAAVELWLNHKMPITGNQNLSLAAA